MKELRIGIIGTGVISHRHMKIWAQVPGVKVVAAAEIDEEKLKKWGEQYKITDLYTDFRELLARDDIDAVDVCAHNNLHAPLSIEVMKAGKDCYCEKPMAGSYADCLAMMEVARATGRKLAVQLSSIFTAQTRIMKEIIDAGELGHIYHARSVCSSRRRRPGVDVTTLSHDFFSATYGGHGSLFDLGVYHLAQLLYVLDLPELDSVFGVARQEIDLNEHLMGGKKFEVEEFASAMATFKGGLSIDFTIAWAANIDSLGDSYIAGSRSGLQYSGVDCFGGYLSVGRNMPPFMQPKLKLLSTRNGREFDVDLKPMQNEMSELSLNREVIPYSDNQLHWAAFLRDEVTEETRINTPLIAANTAFLSEGVFLSSQAGRSLTAEEIREMSKSSAVRRHETPWGVIDYDF